jgi:hypothetical protein
VGVVIGDEAGVVSEGAHTCKTWKCPRLDHHAGDLWMASEILVGRSRQRAHVLPSDRPIWSHREHVAIELDVQHRPFLPIGVEHTAAVISLIVSAVPRMARETDNPTSRSHHGFTTSRYVTTKSVRSAPHCEQRNRSSISGIRAHLRDVV